MAEDENERSGIFPALNTLVQAMHGSKYDDEDELLDNMSLNQLHYGLPPSGLRGMTKVGLCTPKHTPPPNICPLPTTAATTHTVKLYLKRCSEYSTQPNSGVLTAFRHGLREVRVGGGFTDHDMLPFADVLLCGSPPLDSSTATEYDLWCTETGSGCTRSEVSSVVRRIERLDFTRSMSKINGIFVPRSGIRSHGAVSLAKVLLSLSRVVFFFYVCDAR
jgi:hypothetical protein